MSATEADWGGVFDAAGERFASVVELGTPIEEGPTGRIAERRLQVRRRCVTNKEASWLPPRGEVDPEVAAAVSDHLILVAPLSLRGMRNSVVELAIVATTDPQLRDVWVRFVWQAVQIVDEFLLQNRLRDASAQQIAYAAALQLTQTIHESIDLDRTAYAIANEARRFVDCDRVAVLRRRGRRYRPLAFSGSDDFDLRSGSVRAVIRLANETAVDAAMFDSDANSNSAVSDVEDALAEFADQTEAKHVVVAPLVRPRDENTDPKSAADSNKAAHDEPPFAALVFESRSRPVTADGRAAQLQLVVDVAASALLNALEHRESLLPGARVWRRTKRALLTPSAWIMPLLVLAAIGSAVAALIYIPAEFTLPAPAVLQPVERREVFAPLDGTVVELKIRHGSRVKPGDTLLVLENTDLDVALAEAHGERTATQEQLTSVERALFGEGRTLPADQQVRLSGERALIVQKMKMLDERLELLERKQNRLVVQSPIAGEVTTWNVDRTLRKRPVTQGQMLLTVADVEQSWELEIDVPERFVGHLIAARAASAEPLQVTFRPLADPSTEFTGTIKEIDGAAQIRGEHGNTVKATVAVTLPPNTNLKPGAEVRAKIHCGTRSLGYVWLHDVADYLRANVLFRMY